MSDSKAFWGAIQEHCGVNEVCTRQSYDQFGRRVYRWEAVAKGSSWAADSTAQLYWSYTPYGSGQTANTVLEWRNPRSEGNFIRKLYNGLGELIQEQRPYQNWAAGSGAQEIMVDYLYDALGRQSRVGTPWLTAKYSSGDLRRSAYWSGGYTQTTYDPIDRPAVITAPNGEQQTYTYAGRAYSLIGTGRNGDPNKVLRWEERDGLGNLKYVRTYNPNGNSWTVDAQVTLTYDVVGNLTSVTHPNSIGTTSIGYDLGGRKTSMSDPDLGSWSYAYDRQGKLTRQTDARGRTICLYYDSLGRLEGKYFQSTTSCLASISWIYYNARYGYDAGHSSSNRSRGQLTSVSNGSYSKVLTYEARGLLALETVTIAGAPQSYNTYYAADSYLRPTTVIYPDGETVTTNYNSMGLPSALYTNWWGGNPLIDNVSYDVTGRLRALRLPQGNTNSSDDLWRSYNYFGWVGADGNSNGRLHYIGVGTSIDATDRMLLDYRYDSFGNITLHNPNMGVWQSFSYDVQNRLTAGYGLPYTYDSAGRMTSYENIGATAFRGHAVRDRYNSQWYNYDANGNMTARWVNGGWQNMSWNHENYLSSVDGASLPTEGYLYDADGQRVRKTSNGVNTYYPNQYYEQSGSTITKYHYFNGQRVSMHTNASGGWLHYDLHSDHLGSTVLVTNQGGYVHSSEGYYAYGRTRTGGIGLTDHKFTGQKRDGTGLQYFNARYYDPDLGQFLSPDTLVPDPSNLFDYNRYMYTRGNPMKHTDPTGHEPIHHSNYPCSYTTCVKDPMTGNKMPVSNWTPELHKMYYPDISDVPSEPLDLAAVKADVIWAVLPKSGASSFGVAATLGLGFDGVGNIGLIYADKQGNINLGGVTVGIGGNTGANADISMFYNSMPNASSVDIYEGYTVNIGSSAGEVIGGGGEVNITRDSETNQPTVGYTTALGLSAKVNVPVPPVELYGNVTRTWLTPWRFNLYDSFGVPRPSTDK